MVQQALVTFRGVRSAPSPGPETTRFGGNSSCIEVACGDRTLILDAGSGLRDLGLSLMTRGAIEGDILFSSPTVFRTIGLPFFAAAFSPENRFTLHSGTGTVKTELARLMSDPVFPVTPDIFRAEVAFHDFRAGESFRLGPDIEAVTLAVAGERPGTAYRLEGRGWSLAWAAAIGGDDDLGALATLASGTDLLITSIGGSVGDRLAIDLAQRAGTRRLFVTDHLPGLLDDELASREEALVRAFPAGRLAREGETVRLGRSA